MMIFLLIFWTALKDVRVINLGDFTRVAIEVKKPFDFVFSSDGRKVVIKATRNLGRAFFRKNGVRVWVRGRKILLKPSRRFQWARYFVLPLPFKIIVDISSRRKSLTSFFAEKKRKVVVIDPGHGGRDPGTVFGRIKEKTITLLFAKELARYFPRSRYKVILTRKKDIYLDLEERSAIANASECDAFISIHVNSARRRKARGFEIFYFSTRFSRYALYIASRENGIPIRGKDLLLFKISAEWKEDMSISLAREISRRLSRFGPTKVKGAPLYVITGTFCPAVLLELGFITNPWDRKNLLSPRWRKKVAREVFRAIDSFLKRAREL